MTHAQPVYLKTAATGLLSKKVIKSREILSDCCLCPRQCHVNRLSDELGVCNTGEKAWVSSYHAHFGEEAPLVGRHGSGTIFFTHCNLLCNFCQNFDISHKGAGRELTDAQLAEMMISLQEAGCHNINFVTPSHVVPQILAATEIAVEKGLTVPLIYNTSGYDSVDTLKLLEDVIDIYMPDFKFWDDTVADMTCKAPDYPRMARNAILEMHRQVSDLIIDESGIATRGLLIRHLVLPEGLAGTDQVMAFIAQKVSKNSYVNIMPQYRPLGNVGKNKALSGYLTPETFQNAVLAAVKAGIKRLD
jgi:putative pyruvate formate lyase activating enzyme